VVGSMGQEAFFWGNENWYITSQDYVFAVLPDSCSRSLNQEVVCRPPDAHQRRLEDSFSSSPSEHARSSTPRKTRTPELD